MKDFLNSFDVKKHGILAIWLKNGNDTQKQQETDLEKAIRLSLEEAPQDEKTMDEEDLQGLETSKDIETLDSQDLVAMSLNPRISSSLQQPFSGSIELRSFDIKFLNQKIGVHQFLVLKDSETVIDQAHGFATNKETSTPQSFSISGDCYIKSYVYSKVSNESYKMNLYTDNQESRILFKDNSVLERWSCIVNASEAINHKPSIEYNFAKTNSNSVAYTLCKIIGYEITQNNDDNSLSSLVGIPSNIGIGYDLLSSAEYGRFCYTPSSQSDDIFLTGCDGNLSVASVD